MMGSINGIKLSNSCDPYLISDGKHVMLMYRNEEDRAQAAAYWINHGLQQGAVCIYASVHALDQSHPLGIGKLCNKIKDCRENIHNKNLKIVDFRPHFSSALTGNLFPFEKLKIYLERTIDELVAKGKKDKIIVFADAACRMCELELFDKSEILERWWQNVHDKWLDNNYHITVICPHPEFILNHKQDSKFRILDSHDMLVDLDKYDVNDLADKPADRDDMSILILESDPDLMTLYVELFATRNISALVTSESSECLSAIQEKDYDIIILDTHLTCNLKATDLAKEIYRIKPDQRIVLTTTNPVYQTPTGIKSFKVTSEDVLVKPFKLSHLIDTIENIRNSLTPLNHN